MSEVLSSSDKMSDTHRAADAAVVSGHTPGPWVLMPGDSPETSIVLGQGFTIATVWGGWRDYEPNGRLIAAAPDLLEALLALKKAVCGETGFANAVRQVSGTAYPWPELDIAEEAAAAAIAKATASPDKLGGAGQ